MFTYAMQIGEWNKIRASHIIPKYPQAYFHKKKHTHTQTFSLQSTFSFSFSLPFLLFAFASVYILSFRLKFN